MRTSHCNMNGLAGAALLTLLLGGCGKPVPAPDVPEPVAPAPAPTSAAGAVQLPAPQPAAAVVEELQASTPAQASASTGAAAKEPVLAAMNIAKAPSKLSVPVELRYQFDAPVQTGQPVTLHLAAVPRVEGSNLVVSVKDVPGVRTTVGELRAQKVTATNAYRRQLSVTKLTEVQRELRVLVTMDMPEGSSFGWFSVPFDAPAAGQKAVVDRQQ